jgi:GNAT superfamily N-acetyltransferase
MRPVKVHALTAQVKPVSVETIRAIWRERWGIPIYTVGGSFQPEAVDGLGAYSGSSELAGLITWIYAGDEAEILTLDALKPRAGVGTALLQAVESKVRAQSIKSVRALATNDNTPAVALLQKSGYRLVKVHQDAVTDIRRAKPQIPERGKHGIPMRDLWELRKEL